MPVEELLGQILRVKGQDVIRLQRGDLFQALRLRRVHFFPEARKYNRECQGITLRDGIRSTAAIDHGD